MSTGGHASRDAARDETRGPLSLRDLAAAVVATQVLPKIGTEAVLGALPHEPHETFQKLPERISWYKLERILQNNKKLSKLVLYQYQSGENEITWYGHPLHLCSTYYIPIINYERVFCKLFESGEQVIVQRDIGSTDKLSFGFRGCSGIPNNWRTYLDLYPSSGEFHRRNYSNVDSYGMHFGLSFLTGLRRDANLSKDTTAAELHQQLLSAEQKVLAEQKAARRGEKSQQKAARRAEHSRHRRR